MTRSMINLAVKHEVQTIRREFPQQELEEKKQQIAENLIKIRKREQELKEIKAEFKAEIDPMKKEWNKLLTDVQQGFEDVDMEVAIVPDYDKEIIEFRDADTGELVGSRKMTPAERQMEIQPANH